MREGNLRMRDGKEAEEEVCGEGTKRLRERKMECREA